MSTYKCPKGHESTESDYCSECGAKIQGVAESALATNSIASTVPPIAPGVITCPDCTAPHEPDSGDFCEICGYNFATGSHGEVPILGTKTGKSEIERQPDREIEAAGEPENEKSVNQSPIPPETTVALEVIVTVDPTLRTEESPPPPINRPPIAFRLYKTSNLIGRSSELRGIHPDIPLDFDDAVSHRHALFNRQPDGTLIVRDIGSTNGTSLNGVELAAMVDTPIQDGDVVTLGHWTRLMIKVVRKP